MLRCAPRGRGARPGARRRDRDRTGLPANGPIRQAARPYGAMGGLRRAGRADGLGTDARVESSATPVPLPGFAIYLMAQAPAATLTSAALVGRVPFRTPRYPQQYRLAIHLNRLGITTCGALTPRAYRATGEKRENTFQKAHLVEYPHKHAKYHAAVRYTRLPILTQERPRLYAGAFPFPVPVSRSLSGDE